MRKPVKYLEVLAVLVISIALGVACKLHWPDSSGWPEVSAFVIGAIALYFQTVEHILTWPLYIVSVVIYAYVFHQGRLFADRDLQILYVFLSVHGWVSWQRGGKGKSTLQMSRLKPILWIPVILVTAVGTALYYPSLVARQDPAPLVDGLLTCASVVTQLLLNRKVFENWPLWVVIDGAYVWLYITRQYYATSILYAAFTVLAAVGWIQWHKRMKELQFQPIVQSTISNYPRG